MKTEILIKTIPLYRNGEMVTSYWYSGATNKVASVTKILGGKENVTQSRYWTHHGGGCILTAWNIRDIEKAITSILSKNCDYTIYEDVFDKGCFISRNIIRSSKQNNQ